MKTDYLNNTNRKLASQLAYWDVSIQFQFLTVGVSNREVSYQGVGGEVIPLEFSSHIMFIQVNLKFDK